MSTFGIVHQFPGGSKEQYEASLAQVHPSGGKDLPEGQTYHAAGQTDDGGWIVVALWDSRESWERFRDGTLFPGFEALGDSGLPGPPRETSFEIHKEQQA
jgi:heme-degrading monooxygenase HmoA